MAEEPAEKRARVEDTPTVAETLKILKEQDAAAKPGYSMNLNNFLDKDVETCSLQLLVAKPVSALQGLAKLGTEALNFRKVVTVWDLAHWKFFKIARGLVACELAEESGKRDAASEMNINKALDKAWETKTLAEILDAPVSALQGLTPKDDEHFARVHVKTIRDLGNWKFARWAEAICDLAEFESVSHSHT
mmetsp:Transcript_31636/g.62147  ORF Transcript_31636/g.62147 Transcript_31636/m.62147 type:complete len:191 (-) Transcript_31636:136-708(-)|eukprot:CAMPEP_0172708664 /NCGR_PEP_ID=MMETSP1074-20121228/51744_1 /TAXON_ID=2916 /ORGANISM="Ceratium fusus, Strain PA161109" /LENGTH=190 /DNA_ID=CAMNT_0013531687 /DNA_START=70 /DNA_END=642 /DNA_ORIENTATION=+